MRSTRWNHYCLCLWVGVASFVSATPDLGEVLLTTSLSYKNHTKQSWFSQKNGAWRFFNEITINMIGNCAIRQLNCRTPNMNETWNGTQAERRMRKAINELIQKIDLPDIVQFLSGKLVLSATLISWIKYRLKWYTMLVVRRNLLVSIQSRAESQLKQSGMKKNIWRYH